MSYEGHIEYLCLIGHRWTENDDSGYDRSIPRCPACSAPHVFANRVDDTNFEDVGHIPEEEWEKIKLTSGRNPTYAIPSRECHMAMRHRLDGNGNYRKMTMY